MTKLVTLMMGALVAATMGGGCFDTGGNGPSPTDGSPTPTNQTIEASVNITMIPTIVNASEPINVTWSVETGSNGTVEIPHTAIHWANFSVADPQTPGDYGNTSGETAATIPGEFNASFMIDVADTIYVRAHAIVDGVGYWSDEAIVTVAVPAFEGEIHTVEIGSLTVGSVANYDPTELEIAVGDAVQWSNVDAGGFPHTATSSGNFDTGTINEGSTSAAIIFDTAGTFEYQCTIHATMLPATIVVEA